MALFNVFGSKPKEENLVIPVEAPQEISEQDEEKVDAAQKEDTPENKQKIITIKWGTGMPIDVILKSATIIQYTIKGRFMSR